MSAYCAKCENRQATPIAEPGVICLARPEGPIRKRNKFQDRCKEFVEGDPKWMTEAEEKKWNAEKKEQKKIDTAQAKIIGTSSDKDTTTGVSGTGVTTAPLTRKGAK